MNKAFGWTVLKRISGRQTWTTGLLSFLALLCLTALVACRNPADLNSGQPTLDVIKTRGKLVAGVKFDSRPFGYLDTDGQLKGFDVALMRELAKRLLGSPDAVEFQQVLSSTRILALNAGSVDVVAATMTITPEREQLIDFTQPYFVAGQAVMIPRTSPIQSVDQLGFPPHAKRILFVFGTTSEANMKRRVPQANYIGFKTFTDAFSALRSHRGDALTTDDTILQGLMMGNCEFRLLPERFSKEPYGIGIRQDLKYHATDSLRSAINSALSAMEKDGTLTRLKQEWLSPEVFQKGC